MDTLKSYSYNLVKHYMRPNNSFLKMTRFFDRLFKWDTKSKPDVLDYYIFSNVKSYPIQIKEINVEKNQIVLHNHGKEAIILKEWSLKLHMDNQIVLKKIDDNLKLEPNEEKIICIKDAFNQYCKNIVVLLLDENSNENSRLEIENESSNRLKNPRKRLSFEMEEYDYQSIKDKYINAKYKFYGIRILFNDNKTSLINSGMHEVDLKGWILKQKTHNDEKTACIETSLILKPNEEYEIIEAKLKTNQTNDYNLLVSILYDEQLNEQSRFELEEFKNDNSIAKRLRLSNDEYFDYHQIVHQTIQVKNEY